MRIAHWLLYIRQINEYTAGLELKLNGKKGGWLTYYCSKDRERADEDYQRYRIIIWYAIMGFSGLAFLVLSTPLFLGEWYAAK